MDVSFYIMIHFPIQCFWIIFVLYTILLAISIHRTLYMIYIQGVRLESSESYCLLLQKYGFYCPPEPTRGSPDMVHLVINAYTFSRQQYKGTMALQTITFVILEPKMPFLWNLENMKNLHLRFQIVCEVLN